LIVSPPESLSVESKQFEHYHDDDNDADDVKNVVTHNRDLSKSSPRAMGKTVYIAKRVAKLLILRWPSYRHPLTDEVATRYAERSQLGRPTSSRRSIDKGI
jgi:hypothetical protein